MGLTLMPMHNLLQVKILRSTNPETPQAGLFISNCSELPSDWLSQWLNSQSERSSKQLPDFGVPGVVLLKLCYLYSGDNQSAFHMENTKMWLFCNKVSCTWITNSLMIYQFPTKTWLNVRKKFPLFECFPWLWSFLILVLIAWLFKNPSEYVLYFVIKHLCCTSIL